MTQRKVLAQREAGHHPLFEARRRHQRNAPVAKSLVGSADQLIGTQPNAACSRAHHAGNGLHEQLLAAAFEPGQAQHLTTPHAQGDIVERQPMVAHRELLHLQGVAIDVDGRPLACR